MKERDQLIGIIDYGLGNLFSIKQACNQFGMPVKITSSSEDIQLANAIILPGVGAFGDAMDALHRLDLVQPLIDYAQTGKTLIGICLGQQLLFSESHEFGRHKGLGIIEGQVIRFDSDPKFEFNCKIPQVCWNRIFTPDYNLSQNERESGPQLWERTPLKNIDNGSYMYFVHSYCVVPEDESVWLSKTLYGNVEFCSAIEKDNIIAFQFHPERSGPVGLRIYKNVFERIGT
jgi:glutamine amidotransferase